VLIQILEQGRARARAVAGHHPGQRLELRIADRLEQQGRDHLALAADDAVDGAVGVVEELGGDERRAVAAHEDEGRVAPGLGLLGQVHHLRDVGPVVDREAHRPGGEGFELARALGRWEDLQVEQPAKSVGQKKLPNAL
jgi:hypothetical protein